MQGRRENEAYMQKGCEYMIKWATVTKASPFKVKFDGETEESPRVYKKAKAYTPAVNDRVCFFVSGNQFICLGAYV